ncbi:GNAT family N-acetyltransferase [Aliikangiella sp. IMCC44359]|uniref:GNAT family N-acetyltransferase n=1 Tax=Aliikangiella sp. IMCC44359 TaxID=3459125 RepID=UPI00403B3057
MAAAIQIKSKNTDINTQWKIVEGFAASRTEKQYQQALKEHCENIHLFQPKERQSWLNALKQFIQKNKKLKLDTLRSIINFSFLVCDWHLLIDTCNKLTGLQTEEYRYLVYAYWKIGNWNKAYELLNKQMLAQPEITSFYDLYLDLVELSNRQELLFYTNHNVSKNLKLEPLSTHHADEYLWQYWEQSIAELCCLPKVSNLSEWHHWFTYQQSFNDQSNFAVVHETFGFIGVVSLIVHRQAGFFYFWIGKDFQGKGFGTEAVKLLLGIGEEYFAINCCYAKVFEHNIASQKSMLKLGFKRLSFNAAAPNQNEQLYYLGDAKSDRNQMIELHQLLCDMKSDTNIDIPIKWLM